MLLPLGRILACFGAGAIATMAVAWYCAARCTLHNVEAAQVGPWPLRLPPQYPRETERVFRKQGVGVISEIDSGADPDSTKFCVLGYSESGWPVRAMYQAGWRLQS